MVPYKEWGFGKNPSENGLTPIHDNSIMWFGQWKGFKMKAIPSHWFLWFIKQPWSGEYPELVEYAKVCGDDSV